MNTAQKMKFPSFLRIWPHLLKKSVVENFIFCAVKMQTQKIDKSFSAFKDLHSQI